MAEAVRCMFFFAAQEHNQLLTIDVTAYHGYEDFTIDLMATAINMMPASPSCIGTTFRPFINTYKHLHTHTHIHRQIYVCFQRILKAFIWQLNKGFNFKFLALKTKQGLQNSYYDPWHYNTSLAFSKYEPSN